MAKVSTAKGDLDEALLKKQTGRKDNEHELTNHVEYWLGGNAACEHTFDMNGSRNASGCYECPKCGAEQVRRDVDMKLKKAAVFAEPKVASFR